jgi:hypothetical protein
MARNAQGEHWAGNDFHSLHLVKGLAYRPLAKVSSWGMYCDVFLLLPITLKCLLLTKST